MHRKNLLWEGYFYFNFSPGLLPAAYLDVIASAGGSYLSHVRNIKYIIYNRNILYNFEFLFHRILSSKNTNTYESFLRCFSRPKIQIAVNRTLGKK